MTDKFEVLAKEVYREWKKAALKEHKTHPQEEMIASFLESRLSPDEYNEVMEHLLSCADCSGVVSTAQRIPEAQDKIVPEALIQAARGLVAQKQEAGLFEIMLRLKCEALEILSTTGDILVGNEFIPVAVLRSRKEGKLDKEVVILKEFQDIRVEAKIENRSGKNFNLAIAAKEKKSQKIMPGLRIALLKDGLELESYLETDSAAVFENIALGKYTVAISAAEIKLASIILDISK